MRRVAFRAAWLLYLTVGLSMVVVPTASAYIDPGSGSLIFQAIVAGLVAIPVVLAAFWGRITGFFRRKR